MVERAITRLGDECSANTHRLCARRAASTCPERPPNNITLSNVSNQRSNLERARINGKVMTALSLCVGARTGASFCMWLTRQAVRSLACGFGRPGDRVPRLFFSFARSSTHKCVPRTKYDGTVPMREVRHEALGSTVVTDHCVTVVETAHARQATQHRTCCDPCNGP